MNSADEGMVLAGGQENGGYHCEIDGRDSDTGWNKVNYNRKRQKLSSGGDSATPDKYNSLSIDEKLSVIYTEMHGKMASMEQKLDRCLQLHNKVDDLDQCMNEHESRLLLLEYKSLDLEARTRRNNLIFNGMSEARDENCMLLIKQFLQERLGLSDIRIERAHRLGRFNRSRSRPIIVSFLESSSVQSVLSNAHKLKGSPYSINKDFPQEIANARKSLWGEYKQLKQNYPHSNINIVYPAKLIKDGRIVRDLFPRWNNIMSGNRVQVKAHSSADKGSTVNRDRFYTTHSKSPPPSSHHTASHGRSNSSAVPEINRTPKPVLNNDKQGASSPPKHSQRQSRSPLRADSVSASATTRHRSPPPNPRSRMDTQRAWGVDQPHNNNSTEMSQSSNGIPQ